MKKFRLLLTALALTVCGSLAFAQSTIKVSGVVTEVGTGYEVPAVAITVKGSTTNRTISDDFGAYQISVPSNAVLVFQVLGYKTVEVPVAGKSVINVSLELDSIVLEGAISVGYGSAKKVGNIVGSVTTVDSEVVKNAPAASALDLLQGQVAGMQVLSTGGVAGDNNISMKIHGVGSLSSSSEPLFIVDGIQSSSSAVMAMNPNDIQNISVLTDASATSIYGSQGANGVVYVTTKSGAFNQEATVKFTSQYGISTMANEQFYKNMMNASELKNFWMRSGLMTESTIYKRYTSVGYDSDTQWYKHLQRLNNPQYQNDITIEGGSDKTAYMIAASQFHQDGNTIGNYYDRYTLRSNIQARPKEWLKIGANVNFSMSQDMVNENWGSSSGISNYLDGGLSYLTNPLYYAIDPATGKECEIQYPTGIYNQYYYHKNYFNEYTTYRVLAAGFVDFEPVKNLVFTSRVGTDSSVQFMDRYLLPSAHFANGTGMVQKSTYVGSKSTINNTLKYSFNIDNTHDFAAYIGQEYVNYNYFDHKAFGSGIKDDRYLSLDNTVQETKVVSQGRTQYRFLSYFGNFEYSYKDKYYADITVRNDASSRFGKNKRSGTFWATGLMWKLSNEEGFKADYPWVNKLNLKASYGTQGNANVGNYSHLGTISQVSTPYNGAFGIILSSPANGDITWENQSLLTLALESSLFDNKLELSMAYYDRRTTDMLMSVPNPYTSGFTSMYANVGAMRNNGIDLEINLNIINTRDAYLATRFTFAYNNEKVTELFNGLSEWVIPNTGVGYIVGQPVVYYDVIYAGVDPEDGAPMWYLPAEKTETVTDPVTGLPTEVTTLLPNQCNKDPKRVTKVYNAETLTQNTGIRRNEPINGGFGISARYKDFSLRADFAYVLGKYVINNDAYFYANPNKNVGYNQHKSVGDYWTPYNTDARFPDWTKGYEMKFDTHLLENASFLRLKTLVFAYNVPQRLLMKQKVFKSAAVTLTGRNLFTLTQYEGMDPEVDSNVTLGIPGNTLQVLGGIELKF